MGERWDRVVCIPKHFPESLLSLIVESLANIVISHCWLTLPSFVKLIFYS